MIVTTWDGHLRVDLDPGGASVTLTLLTVEATTEATVRAGLVAGFVTGDPDGPPALVTADITDGRLPDDVAVLVGPRVADAVAALAAAGSSGNWLRLDLAEVDDLAAAWAPYRVRVLEPGPSGAPAGAWAGGLWARLDLPDVDELLGGLFGGGPEPVFRGDPGAHAADEPPADAPPTARGEWLLPATLAAEAGCGRAVSWSVRPGPGGTARLLVEARRVGPAGTAELVVGPGGTAELVIGLDEPGGTWEPLRTDPAGGLRAEVPLRGDGPPALRFRTRPRAGR